MRREALAMGVALIMLGFGSALASSLEVTVVSSPDRVPLGIARPLIDSRGPVEGWVQVEVRATVSNVGSSSLQIVPASFWGYPSEYFTIYAVAETSGGEGLPACRPIGQALDVIIGRPRLDPGWKHELDVPVCLPGVGKYNIKVVAGETASSYVNIEGEELQLWTGTSSSRPVTIEIVEPRGVDREAYEWSGHDPLGDSERYGELLGRFPTSTYAAYVVWNRYAKGWAEVETQRAVAVLAAPYPFRTELVPCNAIAEPSGMQETRFGPEGVFRCRAAWFELVLASHPDIWFADEVRLRLALDRYRLGDREACAAGLEALAAHGRPYVAAKAGELLAAMRAGGMLPGEGE